MYKNWQTGVKCGLKHNENQGILKWNKMHYHLQKIYHVQYINMKKEDVGFKNNIKKHGLTFHYNIKADPMLSIGYVSAIWTPCRCSEF